jgi:hypothetical protein
MSTINDVLAEIESGQRLERQGFAQLVEGTSLTAQDVGNRVYNKDWYLTAGEALDLRLVGGVI